MFGQFSIFFIYFNYIYVQELLLLADDSVTVISARSDSFNLSSKKKFAFPFLFSSSK